MKRKWWILGGVALAVAISLCFSGVRLRIAPRLILSRALGSAITQLDTRFANSPVHILAGALDPEGRQQAKLKLETESRHMGPVVYDMALQIQTAPNRILAEGSVLGSGRVLDLSLFLNGNFAAISSQGLVDGRYYGIKFDTFSRDIRDRQLLAALIGTETISSWEASVASLQHKMAVDLTLPEIRLEDVRSALYCVLALKPEISRADITLTGGAHQGQAVAFRATGAEIYELTQPYRDQLKPELLEWIDKMQKDPEAAVSVQFYLHKGKLVQIQVQLHTPSEAGECLFYLGENPAKNTLSLAFDAREGEQEKQFSVMIRTESDAESYEELLYFVKTENGERESAILDYRWDLSSGDMELEVRHGERKAEQRLNLTGAGETVTIRAQNIRPLLNFLLKQEKINPAICSLTLSPGDGVDVPEYTNLDQWSAEDLLSLLGGLGGLLGLKLP